MKKFSLIIACVLLALSFVFFVGGLGGIMWFFTMFPDLSKIILWSMSLSYLLVWFGGILFCAVRFRKLSKQIKMSNDRTAILSDYIVVFGHIVSLVAFSDYLGLPILNGALFYGVLMLAASLYALGLSMLALTGASKRTLNDKIHP